jgi:hypothetical protein
MSTMAPEAVDIQQSTRNTTIKQGVSGRILGSYIASISALFFSFVALWPMLFTERQAFGALGAQFAPMWFWAVPAAVAGLVLALGHRSATMIYSGRSWTQSTVGAIALGSVAILTSLVVGIVLFNQLPL